MKLEYQNLQVDGQLMNLVLDFDNPGTQAVIRVLHHYPRIMEAAYQTLTEHLAKTQHLNLMNETQDVPISPLTEALLLSLRFPRKDSNDN